jgi:hypothetical protein
MEASMIDASDNGMKKRAPADGVSRPLLRLGVVVAMLVIGVVASRVVILSQIGYGLPFGALIAVWFGTVWALPIGALNLVLATIWLVPYRPAHESVHHWIVFLNRQAGHLAFFLTWSIIAVAWKPSLYVQLPLVAFVLLLGEWVVDTVARLLIPGAASASRADFLWIRRPIFYYGTIVGGGVLVALAPSQLNRVLPLFVAIGAGTSVRFLKLLTRKIEERSDRFADDGQRQRFRRVHAERFAYRHDKWVPLCLVFGLVIVTIRGSFGGASSPSCPTPPPMTCQREPGGPVGQPALGMFIVSDTQLHELRGPRYDGQVDLMGAFVPVAVRPVELDTLSAATLLHFRDLYRDIHAKWAGASPVTWVHLGDFADSGCVGEVQRFQSLFEAFQAVGPFAGIAPGNHDSAFTGNFGWHPDWDVACPSGHLDKLTSDAQLREMLAGAAGGNVRMIPLQASAWRRRLQGAQSALATLTPLGLAPDRQGPRGVIAVFLDTSDRLLSDPLIAGNTGTVSDVQVAEVEQQIDLMRKSLGGSYQTRPAYIVLFHHPLKELSPEGRKNVRQLGADLDGGGQPGGERHLLAFISAHTHLSEGRLASIGSRSVRELVVGSTIDAPQEAALLTIGQDAQGDLALRLQTIQSVDRAGASCGSLSTGPTDADCTQVILYLSGLPRCRALTGGPNEKQSLLACEGMECNLPLADRVRAVAGERIGKAPEAIRDAQWASAADLLSCICEATGCRAPEDALDERRSSEVLEALFDQAGGVTPSGSRNQNIVTCLSWAAAAEQAYKAKGMTMRKALTCAFSDQVLPPPKEFVASLNSSPADHQR